MLHIEMTTEVLQHPKESGLPIKILEILSTIPKTADFWDYHKQEKPIQYTNPQAIVIDGVYIEQHFTTTLETTNGKISVAILQQNRDVPNIDSRYALRLVLIGNEDCPLDYYLGSEETNIITEEPYLASGLINNLMSTFRDEKTIEEKSGELEPIVSNLTLNPFYRERVYKTITSVIKKLHVETFG